MSHQINCTEFSDYFSEVTIANSSWDRKRISMRTSEIGNNPLVTFRIYYEGMLCGSYVDIDKAIAHYNEI